MKTLLLIDANALIHRTFHALPPLTTPDGKMAQALYGLSSIFLKIWRGDKPDYSAAFYDRPEPTLREKEYKEYKAQRPKAADGLVSQIISSHELFQKFGIKTFEVPGHEADDLIGTFAKKFGAEPDLKVVVLTGDLDALQLVSGDKVVVRTLRTGISETIIYDDKAVKARYGLTPHELPDYKALVGDSSDNIPGVPGVGPKTASTLLQKYGTLENLYKNLDEEPKIKDKFLLNKEKAFLYKKLTTINCDVPLKIPALADLGSVDVGAETKGYFEKLGFESLVKRAGFISEAAALTKQEKNNIPAEHEDEKGLLIIKSVDDIPDGKKLASSKTKIGFDLKEVIKTALSRGLPINGPYFDLGVGFWLLDSDFKKYTPEAVFKKFFMSKWRGEDEDYLRSYRFLRSKIDELGLTKVFYGVEMPLLRVLAQMEVDGIGVDVAALERLRAETNKKIDALVKVIYELAGKKINLNSPKQLSELLFNVLGIDEVKIKRTATGFKSTNVDSLVMLKGRHPIIDKLLEYREIFKIRSTYIEPILDLVGDDGRLRTDYVQTGTATGRLSSQNPNLQNIPASESELAKKLKSSFIAARGCVLLAADYSQLELRILASTSGDSKMLETFKRGEDIHTATAAAIFKTSTDSVTREMRRLAKVINFGVVYGMGANALAKTAGIKKEEALNFIGNYFGNFPDIKIWQETIKEKARARGYVLNLNGRRRNVAAITYGSSRLASEAERIAINMPIQSLEADIIKLAMIEIDKKLPRESGKLLLSIHDELLFEVRDDKIEETAVIAKDVMENIYALKVPLTVKIESGENWDSLR